MSKTCKCGKHAMDFNGTIYTDGKYMGLHHRALEVHTNYDCYNTLIETVLEADSCGKCGHPSCAYCC